MAALPVDRLRQYLRDLPSGARALLIAELERAAVRGDEIPGGEMLLQEVRAVVRDAGERVRRIGNPARLFFRPVEPFLVDIHTHRKLPRRVARSALQPIWNWIARDLIPAETQAYCDEVNGTIAGGDLEPPEPLAHALHSLAAERMRAALEAATSNEKALRRLAYRIGTPNACEEAREIAAILAARDALDLIASQLPGHIRNLSDNTLATVSALLDSPVCPRELQAYALVLVMNRMAAPWQLIRLAIRAADSDHVMRIGSSPLSAAVSIALSEIERMVDELRVDLKHGANIAVTSLLKCIHDAARGVRTELDLSADSPWTRQLASIRSEISDVLKAEIEAVPGRVRRLLRPRPLSEIAADATLASEDVAETEALIDFVGACRNYAGELAVSEVTARTFQELQQYLDTGTRALLDGLRVAGAPDHPFRKAQVDAAIRFCAKAFGNDYASLLMKAAEMALNAERWAVARA